MIGLAIVLSVGLTGCLSSTTADPDSESSQEALELGDATKNAMETVESYQMTMDMTVEVKEQDRTVEMHAEGTYDREDEQAAVTVEALGRTAETYIDGTTVYAESSYGWQTTELEEDPWSTGSGTTWEQQEAILEDSAMTIEGNETVDGQSAKVVAVDITSEQFQTAMAASPNAEESESIESVDDIAYTLYVSEETNRILKIEMSMTAEIETAGEVDYDITITFSNYNDDVTIEIPDEATERLSTSGVTSHSTTAASESLARV